MEPFPMFAGHDSHVFRKKNPNENAENEVSVTCYTSQHVLVKLAHAQFYSDFPPFLLPIKFLQTFSNVFQALLSV